MHNLHAKVLKLMKELMNKKVMFTVFDITRLLRVDDSSVDHNDVRSWVEYYYTFIGLTRTIGYHLSYSPPPQIYHQFVQNIKDYNPDQLKPVKEEKVVLSKKSIKKCKTTAKKTEHWYALVNKNNGNRVTPNKNNNPTGLYKTVNGPTQLLKYRDKRSYKIVKYEVLLNSVEN